MNLRGHRAGRMSGNIVLLLTLASAAWAQAPTAPLPPPRPDRPANPVADPEPRAERPPLNEAPAERMASDDNSTHSACLESLSKLGLRFEKRPPVQEGRCSIENPVLLSSLSNGIEVAP